MRHKPVGAEAFTAAKVVKPVIVVPIEPPAFHDRADIGGLVVCQAELARDFDIGNPGAIFLFFNFCPVEFPYRVAAADLQVMAEIKDSLAIGLDHLFGHPYLVAFQAAGHTSSPVASPAAASIRCS